jgi:hypothetical protein
MGRKPNWTAEEKEYLGDKWGTVSIKGIASHLGKSINAIKLKAARMGFDDARFSGDGITLNQLALAINREYSVVKYWYLNNDLPARKKVFCQTAKVLFIGYLEFWKWAEVNKDLVNFSKFAEHTLGPEPVWVKEKRRADYDKANKSTAHSEWTEQEDKKLLSLVNAQRYTYPEISKMLNRNATAVKRRLYDIGSKARPVRLNNHIKWTIEETNQLILMAERGHGYQAIAEKIGKSELAVRGKLERMNFDFMRREFRSTVS